MHNYEKEKYFETYYKFDKEYKNLQQKLKSLNKEKDHILSGFNTDPSKNDLEIVENLNIEYLDIISNLMEELNKLQEIKNKCEKHNFHEINSLKGKVNNSIKYLKEIQKSIK